MIPGGTSEDMRSTSKHAMANESRPRLLGGTATSLNLAVRSSLLILFHDHPFSCRSENESEVYQRRCPGTAVNSQDPPEHEQATWQARPSNRGGHALNAEEEEDN